MLFFHTCRKLFITFHTFYLFFFQLAPPFLFLFRDINSYIQCSPCLHFTTGVSSKNPFHLFFLSFDCSNFLLVLYYKRGCKSTPPVGVQVPLLLHSLHLPLVPYEACRATAQHQRAASGLRWNAKHRVNPVFMLTVSFDKVLSELTYGNLVMMCLHTVISSAFHPYFLGLTIVPIMSVIVNVLHSLSCSSNRHAVVLFARVV